MLTLEIRNADAAFFCERFRCGRSIAVIIESNSYRRTFLFYLTILLLQRELMHTDGKASRAGIGLNRAMLQAGVDEFFAELIGERRHQRTQRFRRQLFRADFNQEAFRRTHRCASRPTFVSSIGNPSASRLAK